MNAPRVLASPLAAVIRSRAHALTMIAALVGLMAPIAGAHADALRDSVGAEIGRWSAYLHQHGEGDEEWKQLSAAIAPVVARAVAAWRDGRTLFALQRIAAARAYLAAAVYTGQRPEAARDSSAFEAEWTRMGASLADARGRARPERFDAVHPAALRALAEAALPQVHISYEASLDYGRNTAPQYGLYYLGQAQAQYEFLGRARAMSTLPAGRSPATRRLGPELDSLETEVLAAYRPPASIDRHPEFIALSATLKEARELDAAGLQHGALLRYLQAAQRFGPLRPRQASVDAAALRARAREWSARLADPAVDHSLGRMFLENAEQELAAIAPDSVAPVAAAIIEDVLPRYAAALSPGRAPPRPPPARATVTLVRWPYT